jgi:PAS domain S-box-containing protein
LPWFRAGTPRSRRGHSVVTMQDVKKTKAELVAELRSLRHELALAEASRRKSSPCPEPAWEDAMARRYLDIAGVIILALNKQGEITLINKKGSEILGWQEKDLIGRSWFDHFIPPALRDKVRSVFTQLMSGEKEEVEYHVNPILTRSGETRVIAWYNSLKKDEQGRITGIISSGEDITRQKIAEDALRESEERYRKLVETSPDAVTVSNLDGEITFVSRQTMELHGFSDERDLLGKSAFDLIAPRDRAKAMLNMRRTLKEGLIKDEEYTLVRTDGSQFIGEMNAAVIRGQDGQPKMFIATTRDVTQRKQADQVLHKSIRDKELLLQEIHHRVKNNLQVISSLLDMTGMRVKDEFSQSLLEDARAKIQTMTFIHSQLYRSERFDRIEMGVHIRQLIQYLSFLFGRKKNIRSYVDINEVYLPLTQAIPCALVLNELISNAFKHAFEGTKKGTVEVAMKITQGNRVFITVRDDGIGLDERINIQKTNSLGLKLVRNLVQKQLKGRIRLKSGEYTEFQIDFAIPDQGG